VRLIGTPIAAWRAPGLPPSARPMVRCTARSRSVWRARVWATETVKGMGELRWASYNQPYVSAAGE
jgi:hypothetical protein